MKNENFKRVVDPDTGEIKKVPIAGEIAEQTHPNPALSELQRIEGWKLRKHILDTVYRLEQSQTSNYHFTSLISSIRELIERENLKPAITRQELENMSKTEIIDLVARFHPTRAAVLLMTEDEQAKAAQDVLIVTAITSEDKKEAREHAKLWMDRKLGAVVQKQESKVAVVTLEKLVLESMKPVKLIEN